ncbi:hypothetical protein GR157_31780 [Burkholderia sp. 4701]|nr:hypothetical protein [Burkholderia sp. 4701]MXN86499.1 hypothetical protein [Burkholderia sp. 4812]
MTTLQLSEKTWAAFQAADERNFVATVRDYPAVADDPTLLERLHAAYVWTKEHGFTHDGPIVEFLDVEATTPGFYKSAPVAAWLNKPGVSGEQRFDMLMQATRKRQQEMKEKH